MFHAARWRLAVLNAIVLSVIILVLELVVYTVFSNQIFSGADQELSARQAADRSVLAQSGIDPWNALMQQSSPDLTYRTIIAGPNNVFWSSECATAFPACQPYLMEAASWDAIQEVRRRGPAYTDTRTVTFRGNPTRVLTFGFQTTQGAFIAIQISRIATGEADALQHLRWLMIIGGIIGVVVSALASLFLANQAFVPIRQAFSRQRQFTADASHELRTPLALIRANAEMMARHVDRYPAGDGELVGEIIDETDHLNRLVSDLLTLARADAEVLKIESKPVDMRSLVNDVHEDVRRIAESRGIESDIALNGAVTVNGDEVRLRQLVLILLDNALKYTDPGGRVDVSLGRQDNHARLAVSDTGIGIPQQDQRHIFDRFYRVDRAREHESGGTGLGLSIAQWIAQAHGGTIKVESAVGKGSTFVVDLPVG
jgi:signal transduction histidine kinase